MERRFMVEPLRSRTWLTDLNTCQESISPVVGFHLRSTLFSIGEHATGCCSRPLGQTAVFAPGIRAGMG